MSRTGVALVLGAPVFTVFLHRYVVCLAVVQSESMAPTLMRGDRLVVVRLAYRLGQPRTGDVVVFDSTRNLADPPGTLRSSHGRWLVKRVAVGTNTTVPPGYLFLTGDNEYISRDSRHFGPIARDLLIGKAVLAYGSGRRVRRL